MKGKDDLSDRFGPMLVKELRQNLRRGSFVVPFLAVQVLAVAAVVMEFQTGARDRYTDWAGMMNLVLLWSSGPLWIVVGLICGVVIPLGGLVLMRQELDEGNHELMLLTRLSRWKVVRGKFLTLWALSILTLVSLIPYVLVRYQIGGVELMRDLACALTVAGLAAVVCAGAIGSSAFRHPGARAGVMLLFLFSAAGAGGIALAASGAQSGGAGVFWHLNALAMVGCFTLLGLGLARSRLRLVVHAYEMKPSFLVIGLLVFTPFIVGMTTAMTAGWAGFVGLVGMSLVALFADVTPKAPAWARKPALPESVVASADPSQVVPPPLRGTGE